MKDQFNREISYARISITDRCDLRCSYCMPAEGITQVDHEDILSYDEILKIVDVLAELGIEKIRLTGGEPLVRRNLPELIRGIKNTEGIQRIVMTTNGMQLAEQIDELMEAGLEGVNISLDTMDEDCFKKITRRTGVEKVINSIVTASKKGLSTKVNCVPSHLNRGELMEMVEFFIGKEDIPLRFIELMPIGYGSEIEAVDFTELKGEIEEKFGKLIAIPKVKNSGPCQYYKIEGYPGKLGFIEAMGHKFCRDCNRIRLTSTGFLKACLQYNLGRELRPLVNSRALLKEAIEETIYNKPEQHQFNEHIQDENIEKKGMSQIGG